VPCEKLGLGEAKKIRGQYKYNYPGQERSESSKHIVSLYCRILHFGT